MKIEKLLSEEISSELKDLKEMDMGDESYTASVDGLTKLIDKSIEIEKMNIESEEKYESRKFDENYKTTQLIHEKRDSIVKNCISIFGIVVSTSITIWGTLVSLEFEKEGSVTTLIGRGFINKLLPRSKN